MECSNCHQDKPALDDNGQCPQCNDYLGRLAEARDEFLAGFGKPVPNAPVPQTLEQNTDSRHL